MLIKTFCSGINCKRLYLTIIAVFAFIFVSDFIIHGILLRNAYLETAHLWRPESEMRSYMLWMVLGQFLIAKFITLIFTKGYEGKGLMEGVRFGFFIGPLIVGHFLIQYSVTPLPCSILIAWVVAGMTQAIIGGIICAATYRK